MFLLFNVSYLLHYYSTKSWVHREGKVRRREQGIETERYRVTDTHIDKHRKRDRYGQKGRELWGNNKEKSENKRDKVIK